MTWLECDCFSAIKKYRQRSYLLIIIRGPELAEGSSENPKNKKSFPGQTEPEERLFAFHAKGGGKRDRAADLFHAIQAFSQLSDTPVGALSAKHIHLGFYSQVLDNIRPLECHSSYDFE